MRRLDQAPHHVARALRLQRGTAPAMSIDGAFAERRGEDLTLRLQRFGLRGNEVLLVFAEIEQAAAEQRQRQDVDREDAQRKRRQAAAPRQLRQ